MGWVEEKIVKIEMCVGDDDVVLRFLDRMESAQGLHFQKAQSLKYSCNSEAVPDSGAILTGYGGMWARVRR